MTARVRRYILRAVTNSPSRELSSPADSAVASETPQRFFPPFETLEASVKVRLTLAMSAARDAGAILLGHLGRLEAVEHKSAIDLVTKADRESEALLQSLVQASFPGDGFLGEEGGSAVSSSGWDWIVDPLDGTTNFVHTFPFFMVSIGVRCSETRTIGVCYAPVHDLLFVAVRGAGAFRNGRAIRVSRAAALNEALVCTGFPYSRRELVDDLLPKVARVLRTTRGLRRTGSACYDLCLVAAGAIDIYFEQGLKPWDLCAGTLIAEEAGARITGYDGGAFELFGNDLVATNGRVHDDALNVILAGGAATSPGQAGA